MRSILIFFYNLKGRFFKRIIPSILRKNLFFSKYQTVDLDFCKIRLNLSSSIDREIYLKGFYEKNQINYLYEISKDQNINYFLDIGSNIGYYALFFKEIENVYAFEPNIIIFADLQKNIEINNSKIIAKNIACSDSSGVKKIWYTDENKMGGSSIYNENDFELTKYKKSDLKFKTVNTNKLDNILNIINKNLLIKIDVERHEINVLKGACEKIFKNNKVIMQIEIQKNMKDKVFNFLSINNFYLINSIGKDYYFKNY